MCRILGFVVLASAIALQLAEGQTKDESRCSASFDGSVLTIQNSRMERQWRLSAGRLFAVSVKDLGTATEWIAQPTALPQVSSSGEPRFVLSQKWVSDSVGRDSLLVELTMEGLPKSGYRFQIFPDAAAVSVQPLQANKEIGHNGSGGASGIETETTAAAKADNMALEILDLAPQHLKLTQVELFDQTDIHNELVNNRQWLMQTNETLRLEGNLFILENSVTHSGLIFLKEAPLPHARPQKAGVDLELNGSLRRLSLFDSSAGPEGSGYRFTTLVYEGGQFGITRALQQYQRQVRAYAPGRDGRFMSNTWGDRSRDARINDAFMRGEITAGARLGVDVIQIDDGWQQGRTANSAKPGGVWNGFWASDPGFWNVNKDRFPDGLAPLIKLARENQMRFGLWFAPDSSNDFANWQRDAARLLDLYSNLGVSYFKIDGVKATSALSEQRLNFFFDRVLNESKGAVAFDLDVTAEIRPGYFGAMKVGPLFVENRYTDRHSYWPHQTLRNLWSLSHYVDPLRLRIEFLNNSRNTKLYSDDPLAPSAYSPEYLFATTMMANPLGWFETSGLPANYFEKLPALVAAWKKEREKMQSGLIEPIGETPDGFAWTGFVSMDERNSGGYLLVFRENNEAAQWSTTIPGWKAKPHKLTLLGGEGSGGMLNGTVTIQIPQAPGFAWFRVDAVK